MKTALCLAIILLTVACAFVPSSEVHVLPVGFKGTVTIFYDVPSGLGLRVEGGARLFDIPSTGVLVLRDKVNTGWVHIDYCFEDAQHHRTPIVYRWSPTTHDMSPGNVAIGISGPRTGGGGSPPCTYSYQQYFVGTQEEFQHSAEDSFAVLDDLVQQLKPCQGGA
jgi:hypothetical protein